MSRLYNRRIALTISRVDKSRFFRTTTSIKVTDLRVVFSIEKSTDSTPNTCTLEVYNLAERTRAEFQHKPLEVRLEAGYAEGGVATLFVGDVTYCRSTLEGVEWVTKMQLGDGARAHRHARVSRSFKAGADKRTIVEEVAKSMGLTMPKSADDARALGDQVASGVVLSGPSRSEMTRILASSGLEWSIQDHTLQVLPRGTALASTAIRVAEDCGMIGVPEFGTPAKAGAPPPLTVSKLIDPSALPAPGRKILLESAAINGLFKVVRVVHNGDTHGAEWQSDIEAVAA